MLHQSCSDGVSFLEVLSWAAVLVMFVMLLHVSEILLQQVVMYT